MPDNVVWPRWAWPQLGALSLFAANSDAQEWDTMHAEAPSSSAMAEGGGEQDQQRRRRASISFLHSQCDDSPKPLPTSKSLIRFLNPHPHVSLFGKRRPPAAFGWSSLPCRWHGRTRVSRWTTFVVTCLDSRNTGMLVTSPMSGQPDDGIQRRRRRILTSAAESISVLMLGLPPFLFDQVVNRPSPALKLGLGVSPP